MSKPQDRAALKKSVQDRLLALESEELASAREHLDAHIRDSILDEREVRDTDDLTASNEQVGLAEAFSHPVQTHEAKVDVIENTDFALTDTVQPGAVVVVDGRHFIVAVSTRRFDVGGVTYMGISQESPIYQAMEGLKAGESFDFNGKDVEIEDVL
ncbi:MAG: hypothetical protein AB7S99_19860 [Pseudodonghicola sp.]